MIIQPYKEVAIEALKEIKAFQKGERKIIKTGRPYLDDHFPVVNGSVITVSAPSSVGKTFELLRILRNVMNKDLNPSSENYVSLNITLEMKMFSIVLRELNQKLKKKKLDIVLQEFTPEELKLVKEYQSYISDDRQYISQSKVTPRGFAEACAKFLEQHKDKETVFIALDHLALVSSDSVGSTGQKNAVIEAIMEEVNNLKMKYNNVVFILVSQTNSDIQQRASEKNVMSQPRQSDLYYSGFTFQISDYVVILVNPLKLGITSYSKVVMERYPHLEKYFVDKDDKGKASLETYGVVYYHLLKCREAESGMFVDIYAEDLNIEDLEAKRGQNREETSVTSPELGMPIFTPALNGFNIHKVEDDDETPF